MSWNKSTSWKQRGENFLVEVVHGTEAPLPPELAMYSTGDGRNRWYVYAYIYPKHPHFKAFTGNSLFQDAANVLPLHSGCSLLREHLDRGETGKETAVTVTSYQVGADYNHYGDGHFTRCDSFYGVDEDFEVFADAKALFDTLTLLGTATVLAIETTPEVTK